MECFGTSYQKIEITLSIVGFNIEAKQTIKVKIKKGYRSCVSEIVRPNINILSNKYMCTIPHKEINRIFKFIGGSYPADIIFILNIDKRIEYPTFRLTIQVLDN